MTSASGVVPERIQWAVELIGVRLADHILEIGCGPGHAVALIAPQLTRGTVTAIDRSPIAVSRARERNRRAIDAGRARVERMALVDAALGRRFPKVFAINVNAFWTAPAETLPALERVLAPRGTAWLVYEPPDGRRLHWLRESFPAQLEEHGFHVTAIETRRFRSTSGVAIVGRPR